LVAWPIIHKAIWCFTLTIFAITAFAQSPAPQQLFDEAVAAERIGDDVSALRIYRRLLEGYPRSIAVQVNLANLYLRQKRYDDAISQYLAVLAYDGGNAQVRLNLAMAYQEKGLPNRAVQELEIVYRKDPGEAQAAILLGDCYIRLNRFDEAVTVLLPVELAHSDDIDLAWLLGSALIRAGRPEEGLLRINRVAEKAPDKFARADAFFLAGQTELGLTHFDLARQDADAVQRLNPTLPGLQTLSGMIFEQTGDYAVAETALRQALDADSRDFDAHFYLGAILYFRRALPEAITHLEQALQLRPASSQVRYELALALRASDQLDAARTALELVARQTPDWLQPHIELSALYYRLHRPDDGAKERLTVDRLTAQHTGPTIGPMP
jgi:tetratricopeptide (TPR) repeat protein